MQNREKNLQEKGGNLQEGKKGESEEPIKRPHGESQGELIAA